MKVFYDYLEVDGYNNKLMQNVNVSGKTQKDMQLVYYQAELKNIMKSIVLRFVQLLKSNRMLAVESLFEFQTKDIKDQILANYDLDDSTVQRNAQQRLGFQSKTVESETLPIDLDNFGEDGGNNPENQDDFGRQIEDEEQDDPDACNGSPNAAENKDGGAEPE